LGLVYRWIHRVWYEGGALGWFLLPLSALYWLLTAGRRFFFRLGVFKTERLSVPVIVVGNITAGGTGKTPVVIWLANELRAHNYSPGIVSRGYGGSASSAPVRVDAESAPAVVGDEPLLLARHSGCPVSVASDRVRAAQALVKDGVDVIIADDGLQHYRLARDYEICVIDGARGLGNRWLLPAGPLRELPERLSQVDQLLVNGAMTTTDRLSVAEQNAIPFELVSAEACRLNESLTRPIERFAGTTVHAVAGIGNPGRFFNLLRDFDIQVIEHAFADHAVLQPEDLQFDDDLAVFMTEKDAVKIGKKIEDKYWSVPVTVSMDPALALPMIEQIDLRLQEEQGR
jgi:tetraacyldisaccharide 4'-kinase